eukprot:363429-Chlamydomonas_euryale.AAC.22
MLVCTASSMRRLLLRPSPRAGTPCAGGRTRIACTALHDAELGVSAAAAVRLLDSPPRPPSIASHDSADISPTSSTGRGPSRP